MKVEKLDFNQYFLRKVNANVSIICWCKLTLIELYVGEQILELIQSVSSFHGATTGWKKDLEYFIPATFINKILKLSIIELIRTKYLDHYKVLTPKHDKGALVGYSTNFDELAVITELKLGYNTIWVGMNVVIDIIVYLVTNDISMALVSGALIEFFRRFKL